MTIEIKDTAIWNIVNGLKVKEENKKYWKGLAEKAKRLDNTYWMAKDFEARSEAYKHEIMAIHQVLAEISTELYDMVKNKVEAN